MSATDAGCRYEYLWEDGVKFKRPTKLSAPEYVDTLMNWAQSLLDDENVFPNKIGMYRLQSYPHICINWGSDRHVEPKSGSERVTIYGTFYSNGNGLLAPSDE